MIKFYNPFKKEVLPPPPPPPSLFDRIKKNWIAVVFLMSIPTTLFGWYGLWVKPDYSSFKKNTQTVAALYPTGALQLAIDVNQIPDIPVTLVVTDGNHEIFHRHYEQGLPKVYGGSCSDTHCVMQEITQLSFAPSNGHIEVKFVFRNWKTLWRNDFTVWKVPLTIMESGMNEDANFNTITKKENGVWV